MCNIISILNHKGGVGKTTTTINLGAALALQGYRTLLIDIDGQSNLTTALLGIDQLSETLYEAFKGEISHLPLFQKEGLAVVPSSLDLQACEIELSLEPGRELILKGLLSNYINEYDYIIIDCPPSLGLLTLNALTASTGILIPVEAEPLALKGMQRLLSIIDKVKHRLNPTINIIGILLTKYDGRKTLSKLSLETLQQTYPNLLLTTKIRDNTALSQAQLLAQSIFEYEPKSMGAEDYKTLSMEIINKTSKA